jgi:signal transduction histidine kinase/FixJ family two-component response regulator
VKLCGHFLTGIVWTTYAALACFDGGHHSPPTIWYTTIPIVAVALTGVRGGIYWSAASLAMIILFYVGKVCGIPVWQELTPDALQFLEVAGLVGLLGCLLTLVLSFDNVEHETHKILARLLEEAQAADRAKSSFLANMSHEIRTPMTAILGYLDLLSEGEIDQQEKQDALKTIRRNGEHLLTIINDVLDLSKIDSGKFCVERLLFNPRQLVCGMAELIQSNAHARNLRLDLEFDDPIPDHVLTDPTRLRQILLNLIGNAIKFTEQGGVRVVTGWREGTAANGQLYFEVHDTGIGITAEQLGRLFQPFQQSDNSMARRFGGTGLGLAICQRLVKLLGGEISVNSRPGAGTTFVFTVAAEKSTATLSAPAAAGDSVGPCPLRGLRILLAEDGPDNQRLISALLRRAGAEVAITGNGQTALEQTLASWQRSEPFDVILMDMQMPILDGYETTRRLRKNGYRLPIIALTAHAMVEDRQICVDAGCDDYATKPIQFPMLVAAIRAQLRQQRGGAAQEHATVAERTAT